MKIYLIRLSSFINIIPLLGLSFFLSSVPLKASQEDLLKSPVNYKSVKTIVESHLNENATLLNSSKNKDIVVFLGATGAGKSTLINFLNRRSLRLNADEELELQNPHDTLSMKIGNTGESETYLPRHSEVEGLVFYDLPGFRDTRGTSVNLINASFIKHLIENSRSARLVFVASQDEITASRGESFKNLLRITENLFPGNSAVTNSSLLVITKSLRDTSENLIPYLSQRLDDRQKASTWLVANRVSPMSKRIDEKQRIDIFQKLRTIPSAVIRNVNIEAIYSEEIRRTLREIFALEMTQAIEESLKSAPSNLASINGINQSKAYFTNSFEQDILAKIETSSLICLLKPLSENSFSEEKAKILQTIQTHRNLNISQLNLKKESIEKEAIENARRQEEQRRIQAENARRQEEQLRIQAENARRQEEQRRIQAENARIEAERLSNPQNWPHRIEQAEDRATSWGHQYLGGWEEYTGGSGWSRRTKHRKQYYEKELLIITKREQKIATHPINGQNVILQSWHQTSRTETPTGNIRATGRYEY